MRLLRARDDHQARRVAVEAVDDPGSVGVAAGDVPREQAVHERAGRVSGRGMDDEACRLVDDDEVLVLVGDPQIHRLRFERLTSRSGGSNSTSSPPASL